MGKQMIKTATPSRRPFDIYIFVSLGLFFLSVFGSLGALIWMGEVGKILLTVDTVMAFAVLLTIFFSAFLSPKEETVCPHCGKSLLEKSVR